eukprot:3630147-Prymnesium_polylepis.1
MPISASAPPSLLSVGGPISPSSVTRWLEKPPVAVAISQRCSLSKVKCLGLGATATSWTAVSASCAPPPAKVRTKL